MATYVFRAIDALGAPARGELEAESKQGVSDQLKSRGLIVVDIADKSKSREINISLFERVKAADLTIMSRQLATMISSGMTILRTLYVLEDQTENKKLRDALVVIRKDVEAGLSLSEALARHPDIFSQLYVSMVAAGEAGGLLESALERVASQLEADDALRRKVKGAMVYPAVVMSFAVLVLVALVAFLVPVFASVFKGFGGDLPPITKFTVALSDLVTHKWYLLIGVTVGVVIAFKRWRKSEMGRRQWDVICLRLPMKIGDIVQKVALARWSRTLSALVTAGVPILQALEVTGKTSGNTVVERVMDDVIASVKSGGTVSAPLQKAKIFPSMVTQMIAVGEETGALDTMLEKVADFYDDQVDTAVKGLTALLEPVMIIVIGGIVGFIVIAMYMPMFKVYDAIK
jgi:type IV pilus assembly protein PilC